MAGHSKWDNIKRKKQKEDAKRGKVFTKMTRLISVAARQGGPDPAANVRLRLAIEKAKAVNVPNETIERAIRRGAGEVEGEAFEEIVYEGYGPGGVAVLLEIMTNNRNRTAADVRHLFSRHGGNLGESGCVAWMFEKKGEVRLAEGTYDEDELMLVALDAGADDVEEDEGAFTVWTDPARLTEVREALEGAGFPVESAEVTMTPQSTVQVGEDDARKLLNLLEALEDLDDVQEVYANFDMPQEVLQALEA